MKVLFAGMLFAVLRGPARAEGPAPAPRAPKVESVLSEMTRAYVPFRTAPHDRRRLAIEDKLDALSKAVLAAGELAKDYSEQRTKAGPAASTEAARELLVIDASLDEAARDLRDISEELERVRGSVKAQSAATVPRSILDPFRRAFSRPYKDLYRRFENLRGSFAKLGRPG